jgi:hypothetical protein
MLLEDLAVVAVEHHEMVHQILAVAAVGIRLGKELLCLDLVVLELSFLDMQILLLRHHQLQVHQM